MRAERDKPERSAEATALALLAGREHSRLELQRKLLQRGYATEEIDTALAALTENGYLDDSRAAAARLASGLRRGHGPGRIRADLRGAGLDSTGLNAQAEEAAVDWSVEARRVALKRFGETPPADYQEWARRARFLQARGYDSETIRKALGDSE